MILIGEYGYDAEIPTAPSVKNPDNTVMERASFKMINGEPGCGANKGHGNNAPDWPAWGAASLTPAPLIG